MNQPPSSSRPPQPAASLGQAAEAPDLLQFPGRRAEASGDSAPLRSELREIREMIEVLYAENPGAGLPPEFVLGLLNSRLLYWRLSRISNVFRGGWITCTKQYVGRLPIVRLDLDKPAERARHDRAVSLVRTMLGLHKELAAAKTPHAQTALRRQIDAADRQIDRLVYDLYDLTGEEIDIVEEATG